MTEKHFESWDFQTVQKIERMCDDLPILPRSKVASFFEQASRVTKQDVKAVERPRGEVFESLGGFVSASDRKDFTVTRDFGAQSPADGMLMLETFDNAIGVLFCVARISERSFMTQGFIQSSKPAIKRLVESGPEAGPAAAEPLEQPAKRRWNVPVPVMIALVLVAAGVLGAWLLVRSGPKQVPPPVLTPEARAYVHAGYLSLSDVNMGAKENFAQQTLVEITGKITNTGNRALKQVEIFCIFRDPEGRVVLRERVPIVKQSLGGLKAGETKEFRLPFDTIPESWNQTLPELVIAAISFA
jgi:hypothetical protein